MMARRGAGGELPEGGTPATVPNAAARTFEGVPDLGLEEDLAAVERERALRGRGREGATEAAEDELDR
jgi:hypothetical protein